MTAALDDLYQPLLLGARARLTEDRRLAALLGPGVPPARLHWFLMQFSAWGIQMTEPVEGWIRRAGDRCLAMGHGELGRALCAHARHEAGHEGMFMQDLEYLVARWNAGQPRPVTTQEFLERPQPRSVARYIDVHEQAIAGEAYAQIAIEYEVERMTPILGPLLVAQCVKVLGPEILQGLHFVQEHVAVDVGHTIFNERQISRFMEAHPHTVPVLAHAGARALQAYVDFLGDCWDQAVASTPTEANRRAA
jgi:hypothetical protein